MLKKIIIGTLLSSLGLMGYFTLAVTWEEKPMNDIDTLKEENSENMNTTNNNSRDIEEWTVIPEGNGKTANEPSNVWGNYNKEAKDGVYDSKPGNTYATNSSGYGENKMINSVGVIFKFWMYFITFIGFISPFILIGAIIYVIQNKDKLKKTIKTLAIIYGTLILITIFVYCLLVLTISIALN